MVFRKGGIYICLHIYVEILLWNTSVNTYMDIYVWMTGYKYIHEYIWHKISAGCLCHDICMETRCIYWYFEKGVYICLNAYILGNVPVIYGWKRPWVMHTRVKETVAYVTVEWNHMLLVIYGWKRLYIWNGWKRPYDALYVYGWKRPCAMCMSVERDHEDTYTTSMCSDIFNQYISWHIFVRIHTY